VIDDRENDIEMIERSVGKKWELEDIQKIERRG
jgi:hypothetical protein